MRRILNIVLFLHRGKNPLPPPITICGACYLQSLSAAAEVAMPRAFDVRERRELALRTFIAYKFGRCQVGRSGRRVVPAPTSTRHVNSALSHQPSRLEQIVNLKILDLSLSAVRWRTADKNVVTYKSACPARKKCVQNVSRGRDQSLMMFWRKKMIRGWSRVSSRNDRVQLKVSKLGVLKTSICSICQGWWSGCRTGACR